MAVMQASEAKINFTKTRLASPDGNLWNLPKYGMVLLKPTSIESSGGTATLGTNGQITVSAVSSLSLNGIFSSTYDNYAISIRVTGNYDTTIFYRMRSAGTDASGANYTGQILEVDNASLAGTQRSTGITSGRIGSTSSSYMSSSHAIIYGPNLAQPTVSRSRTLSGYLGAFIPDWCVSHSLANSYDGITFFISTYNMSGTIQVYGIRS